MHTCKAKPQAAYAYARIHRSSECWVHLYPFNPDDGSTACCGLSRARAVQMAAKRRLHLDRGLGHDGCEQFAGPGVIGRNDSDERWPSSAQAGSKLVSSNSDSTARGPCRCRRPRDGAAPALNTGSARAVTPKRRRNSKHPERDAPVAAKN
jgi:hypothetical protein